MCPAGDAIRKVQEQQLRNLHRQLEEICSQEARETLVLLIPEDHPLNKIEPIQAEIAALRAEVAELSAQNKRLIDLMDKIGGMTFEIYQFLAAAKRQAERSVIVPGRG